MKIAYINNFYNAGGSTKTAYTLAQNFSKDHEMRFYGCFDGIYRKKFDSIGPAYLFSANNFDYNHDMIAALHEYNPDILHVFIPGAQNPTYFTKLPNDCKKFATVMCEQKIGFDHNIFNRIFFQSSYGESYSGKVNNGVVVRPGYDYNFVGREQRKTPVLARVSAFCPSKKIDHTILACSRHKDNITNIVGEIQDHLYFKKLLSMKEILGLRNLTIQENATDSTVEKIINECDIWHYPTSSEVFCFSVLEAMAAKKPVISYKTDAVCEFFDSDDWLANDIEDMFEKTARLIRSSPSERETIGLNNYQVYLKHTSKIFSDKIMSEYMKSFQNI